MKPWENKLFAYGVFGSGVLIFLLALLIPHHKASHTLKPMPPSKNINMLPSKQGVTEVASAPVAPVANGQPLPPSAPTSAQQQATSQNNNTTTESKNSNKSSKRSHLEHHPAKVHRPIYHKQHTRRDHKYNRRRKHYRQEHEQRPRVEKEHFDSTVVRAISNGNVACSANGCILMLSNGDIVKPMHTYHGYLIKSITLSHVVIENSNGNAKEIGMGK